MEKLKDLIKYIADPTQRILFTADSPDEYLLMSEYYCELSKIIENLGIQDEEVNEFIEQIGKIIDDNQLTYEYNNGKTTYFDKKMNAVTDPRTD